MKNLLVFLALFTTVTAFSAPIKFKFADSKIATAIDGTTIGRGDQFDVIIQANGNGNISTRQLMFDLQYDMSNFELVSINHTGTGGNGGVLPYGSTISLTWQNYPYYSYSNTNAQNASSTNGNTVWQSAYYTFTNGGSNAIIRATLTWASPNGMPYGGYDRLLIVRFKLKTTSTATAFNPIKFNFVAGWTDQGIQDETYQSAPLSIEPILDQNIGKYVTAKVDVNSNLLNLTTLKVSFRDTLTNTGQIFNVLADGKVDINQSLLSPNTAYQVSVMHEMDKIYAIYNGAITISDFTTAQNQFQTMGLDGSAGTILQSGQSYYAADINRNKTIDGGDLPKLLAQVAGFDTLFTLPAQYTVGSGGWMSLPTWKSVDAMTTKGQVGWAYITPGSNNSTLHIDMRKFTNGVIPNSIKSIQLFDIYSGPIEYVSQDASWAVYNVPSTLVKAYDGTSVFAPNIVNINNGNVDYALMAEFDFNNSVNSSWGAITATNWTDITYPKVIFKTGEIGTNQILDLSYLLWGDVNRSHSSQVVTSTGGTVTLKTNAVNSLATNSAFRTMSTSTVYMNTSSDVSYIDVNLSNATVTSNTVEIPVNVNTNGKNVGGLQFQFDYDPAKIKFEELKTDLPDGWYIFANSKDGKVKFGAVDNQKKNPYNANNIPFKLKFSTIGAGVDILTSVKVSPTMDASASNGTQLGINLNTTQIKLTGYKNF